MTYYIIGYKYGHESESVIYTSPNIAWARKKVKEMIAMDLHVMGYCTGYTITTETARKEYHGVSVIDDTPTYAKYRPGTKPTGSHLSAIKEYKDLESELTGGGAA